MSGFGNKDNKAAKAQRINDELCIAEHGGPPCRTFEDMSSRHHAWQRGYRDGMRMRNG